MQNYQQKENTTYIDGFAVLFFDGMSKERKKYKRTKCNLWRTGKIQKKYKNTNCIFVRNGKIQKKYKNTKCIFFVFYLYLFRIFTKKIRKKYKKHTEKIQKNTNAIAQKYKIQKKYESTISKIQNTKKIRTQNFKNTKYKKNTNPKFQKYKIQRKDKFKNKPESQPRVHFWKSGTKIQKKYNTNQLYFPNPAVLILYFWVVFFSYVFCIFKYW